jgi:hypothetical protein
MIILNASPGHISLYKRAGYRSHMELQDGLDSAEHRLMYIGYTHGD